MVAFATKEELITLWRPLKNDELVRAEKLLDVVSDTLRYEAKKVGKDLDVLAKDSIYLNVLKSVLVDIVARVLMTSTDREPTTQFAESALGYSVSGSFLVPGGGIFIKNQELARLGLKRQRIGGIELYGID